MAATPVAPNIPGDGGKLEAVAIRRLNETVLEPVFRKDLLESGTYLTAATWTAYANAAAAADAQGRPTLGGLPFNDANVQTLIERFGQTLREDRADDPLGVQLPIIDGLRLDSGQTDAMGRAIIDTTDIRAIQDDAGFYLPETITILRTVTEDITVPAAYVYERLEYQFNVTALPALPLLVTHADVQSALNRANSVDNPGILDRLIAGTETSTTVTITVDDSAEVITVPAAYVTGSAPTTFTTTYDSVLGANTHGLWFASFEDVTLNVNANEDHDDDPGTPAISKVFNDTVTIDGTYFIDDLTVNVGDGDNLINISGLTAETVINTGIGEDEFYIHSLTHETTINAEAGDDQFFINYEPSIDPVTGPPQQTFMNGVIGTLNVHGQAGTDIYNIGLSGLGSALINVIDQSGADLGEDKLFVSGTEEDDYYLFRPSLIAGIEVDADHNPVVGGVVERINYDGDINAGIVINGRAGDDTFVLDDTDAALEVNGDRGDDTFQIGQMFQSPRDSHANLPLIDQFPTTQTTQGFLSNGVSEPATFNGGDGEDLFTVFHNLAEISLNGEADNDTFVLRSFVRVDPDDPKAPITNVNGGQGADFISFTVNAPVNIEGGDGLDTLTIIGTELGDSFVVAASGVYGAGRFTRFNGVEKVVIDAIAGNDEFFIQSTSEHVDLEIVGGLGSDQFYVGGSNDAPVVVVANDLKGHSGLIDHEVVSNLPATTDFSSSLNQGISVDIGDNEEAEVLIRPTNGPIRVFEDASVYDMAGVPDAVIDRFLTYSYTVVLTRAPEEDVRITASPSLPNETSLAAGAAGIALAVVPEGDTPDPNLAGSYLGVTLSFTRDNWFRPQTVVVTAPDDAEFDNRDFYEIRHSVIEGLKSDDGDQYDGLAVASLKAQVIDNEAATVVLAESDGQSQVAELGIGEADSALAGNQTRLRNWDQYAVALSAAPAVGETVTIDIATDGEISVREGANPAANAASLTFNNGNWHIPQVVTITTTSDGIDEGVSFSRISHAISSSDPAGTYAEVVNAGAVDVEVLDDTPGVLISRVDDSTTVIEPTTDVLLGIGQIVDAGDGHTFTGNFGRPFLPEIPGNDGFVVAQNIDSGDWSLTYNPNVGDTNEDALLATTPNMSQTIPHLTVKATGDGTADYFQFEVTQEMLDDNGGPVRLVVDLDDGYHDGDDIFWNPVTRVVRMLEVGDDLVPDVVQQSSASDPATDVGSTTWLDTFNTLTLSTAETYYIEVTNEGSLGIPDGADYDLHVSLEQHPVASFAFSPSPVFEDEVGNNTYQDVDAFENFSIFFDPNVGNEAFGGTTTYRTPYTSIAGNGDGTADVYQFTITPQMLNPEGGVIDAANSILDSRDYYETADIVLTGNSPNPAEGLWEATISGTTYEFNGSSTSTLADVAAAFETAIDGSSDAFVTYDATASSGTLTLTDPRVDADEAPNGFRVDSITQTIPQDVESHLTTGGIEFSEATVVFSVASTDDLVDGDTWTLRIGGTGYPHTVDGDSLNDIVTAIRDQIPASLNPGGSGSTITLNSTTPFSIEFEQSGKSARGVVAVTGTAGTNDLSAASWSIAEILLNDTRSAGDTWQVRVSQDGYEQTYTGDASDPLDQIGRDIAQAINDDSTAGSNFTASYSNSANTLTVAPTASNPPVVVDFSILSPANDDTALHRSIVDFSDHGTVTSGETWILTLGSNTYEYVVGTGGFAVDHDGVAQGLEKAVTDAGDGYTTSISGSSVTFEHASDFDGSFSVENIATAATTQYSAEISLSGTVAEGDVWTIDLDAPTATPTAHSHSYTLLNGDTMTLDFVIGKLVSDINDDGEFVAEQTSTSSLRITRVDAFTLAYTDSANGTFAGPASATEEMVFALTGTPAVGEVWVVTTGATPADEYTFEAATTNLVDVANGLRTEVGSGARVDGNSLIVTGSATGNGYSIRTVSVDGTSTFLSEFDVSGTVTFGQTWLVSIAGDANGPYEFAVPNGSTDLNGVATGLRTALTTAGYTVAGTDAQIIIQSASTVDATWAIQSAAPITTSSVGGTPATTWSYDLSLAGSITASDQWSLTLDGNATPYEHVVVGDTTDDTIDEIAGLVRGEIPASYNPTVSGATISMSSSAPITIDQFDHVRVAAFQPLNAANREQTRTRYEKVQIDIVPPGPILRGQKWTIELRDTKYTYDVLVEPGIDSASDMRDFIDADELATKLGQLLTNSSEFDGSQVSVNGSTITLDNINGITAELTAGDGTILGVFDIDGEATQKNYNEAEIRNFVFYTQTINHPVREHVTIELLQVIGSGPTATTQVIATTQSTGAIDAGSSSTLDPFIEYTFDESGDYRIRVTSFKDYLDGYRPDVANAFVSQGLAYQLNISLPQHAKDDDVFSLPDNTITIVDGAGVGQTAIIKSYDPATKTFTLKDSGGADTTFTGLDYTSVFEVTYDINTVAGYTETADQYTVVLTSSPLAGETITVRVDPQSTRNYNADEAFEIGGGQSDQEQVTTGSAPDGITLLQFDATNWNLPQTVFVNAISDNIIDGGDAQSFPAFGNRIADLRGPITLNGGIRTTDDLFLKNPFMLPGERNSPVPDGTVTLVDVDGSGNARFTDENVSRTNADGQVGFDDRMNDYAYEFVFLDGPLADYPPMQVASVQHDAMNRPTVTFTTPWPDGIQPEVGDNYVYSPVNPNVNVVESDQVDTVEIFNGSTIADQSGTLTSDQLTGFGLGPDAQIGDETIPGGVSYRNIETLNFELGSGDNQLDIKSTHVGSTNIYGSTGVESIDVKSVFGHTTIELGAGMDVVNVGDDAQRIEQIAALLTVIGGDDNDELNIRDGGDISSDSGTIKPTSIRGFDMPSVPEVQVIRVRAATGKLVLKTDGFGSDVQPALPVYADEVVRAEGTARVIFDINADDATIRQAIARLYNQAVPNVSVQRDGEFFSITLHGELAGIDLPELEWDEDYVTDSPLAIDLPNTVDVRISTSRDGTMTPDVNVVQTLAIVPNADQFQLQITDDDGLDVTTAMVADTANAETLLDALRQVLDNTNSDLPYTYNVDVSKHDNIFKITFQGAHRKASIANVITGDPLTQTTLLTRTDGIDYFGIETLNMQFGSGDDVINVHGTSAITVTNVMSGDGNDQFMVASVAADDLFNQDVSHGHLDSVQGQLNLNAEAGDNSLFVSDYEGAANPAVVITDTTIDGLAPAQITYEATAGNFDGSLAIWTSQFADVVDVTSVDVGSQTITTLYTGAGDDDIRIEVSDAVTPSHTSLPSATDRRLRVRTLAGEDVVDGSRSQLALRIETGSESDIAKGGHGDDIVHSGSESDIVFGGDGDDFLSAMTDLPGGAPTADDEIVIGDHGTVTYNVGAGVHVIDSTEPTAVLDAFRPGVTDTLNDIRTDIAPGGGDDTIYSGDQTGYVLGGLGDDTISTGNDRDLIFGDGGAISFSLGVLTQAVSIDDLTGGSDDIQSGNGVNFVIAGPGSDDVTAGEDRDYVLGDNGHAIFNSAGIVTVWRSTTNGGGNDLILTGSDSDFVIGGAADDVAGTGSDVARDIVLGDHGQLDFDANGLLTRAITTDPYAAGNDQVYSQQGSDIVLGGPGEDYLAAGRDNLDASPDVVIGDSGYVTFDTLGNPLFVTSTQHDLGANDRIFTGGGDDIVVGGMADDIVLAGPGHDITFGDAAELTFGNGVWLRLESIALTDGGRDQVVTGTGDDITVAGAGNDFVWGGTNGDDVILGDSGLLIGADGSPDAKRDFLDRLHDRRRRGQDS